MIRIICVGKIKEEFYRSAIDEYVKRLSKYTKVDIIEVKDYSTNSIKKEGSEILRYINSKDFNIGMDIKGKKLDSLQFATLLDKCFNYSSNITFIIGGSYGLSDLVKEKCNLLLSFSSLTFPHQLFRVILLEQIYRAFKINNNETYHK